MDRLHKAMDFFIRHQAVLTYIIVSLLTAGSEYLFSSVVFKCPCSSKNMLHGYFFLLVPAFVLFLISLMVNPSTWQLFTGKCSSKKDDQCCPEGICACCQAFLQMTVKALVAPLTWIVVALFGANFYKCAAIGSSRIQNPYCKDKGTDCRNLLLQVPCDEKLSANFSSELLSLHAESQLLGGLLIAGIMTVALISCATHCCSSVSYLQLKFQKIYSKNEEELFEKKIKEHATKLAERNINCFFEANDPAPFHTPSNKDWQKISILYSFNPSQEQYYSMIHKFVSTNRSNSPKFREEGQDVPVLDVVDESQMFQGCNETNPMQYCQTFNRTGVRFLISYTEIHEN